MSEPIWVAVIGLVGVTITAVVGLVVALIRERGEARSDRILADTVRQLLRDGLDSSRGSSPCSRPGCPGPDSGPTTTPTPAPTGAPSSSPNETS